MPRAGMGMRSGGARCRSAVGSCGGRAGKFGRVGVLLFSWAGPGGSLSVLLQSAGVLVQHSHGVSRTDIGTGDFVEVKAGRVVILGNLFGRRYKNI